IQRIRLIALCSGMKHAPTVSANGTGKRKPSTSYHNAPSVQYANFAVLLMINSFMFIVYLSINATQALCAIPLTALVLLQTARRPLHPVPFGSWETRSLHGCWARPPAA